LNKLSNPLQIWHRDGGRPILRADHKTTPKLAWPGHVTQFRNFRTP